MTSCKPHDAVHGVYSVLPKEEVERIRRIVKGFETFKRGGSASIQVRGRLVRCPIYGGARLGLYKATHEA